MPPSTILSWLSTHILWSFNFLLTLIFVSFILRSKKPPGSTWAWLLFIVAIPYVGIVFYLIFSQRKFKTNYKNKEPLFEPHPGDPPDEPRTIERILKNMGEPPARFNSEGSLIASGVLAYRELTELILSAQKTIHLTTFIFSDDEVGRAVLQMLEQKASRGVTVRILVDSLGSTWVRHPNFKRLKELGGHLGYFMPLLHWPSQERYNLRNHRKILVVDSRMAILGGMNIAREYMGPTANPQSWIDLGFKIFGPSVLDVERVFAKDWKFATRENILIPDVWKYPQTPSRSVPPGISAEARPTADARRMQIVASGPDVIGDALYDCILTLIFKADRRIWVATPYFIPDESLAKALQLAAQRGLDVRVIVPRHSNHILADLARGSYIRQLAAAGVRFSFLEKMIHAKALLIDDDYGIIGSANFDMRSLLYNFEIGAIVSSAEEIHSSEAWFQDRIADSDDRISPANFWTDLAEGMGRVLGPLL